MKKLFVNIHENGNATASNYPMKEDGAKFIVLEVSEEEFSKALSGQFKVKYFKKRLSFEQTPAFELSPKKKRRLELREKLESGNHTQEDIVEALKLIL